MITEETMRYRLIELDKQSLVVDKNENNLQIIFLFSVYNKQVNI